MKTKAIIYDGVDQIRFGDVTLPELGPKQVLATTLYTFVSPGTELRVLGGHYGAEGRHPVVPGYAAISRILEVGAEVKGFKAGDVISCRNPVGFADCGSMWGGEAGAHVYSTDYKVEPIRFYGNDWPRLVMQANYIKEISINPFSFFAGEGVTILTPAYYRKLQKREIVSLIGDWS